MPGGAAIVISFLAGAPPLKSQENHPEVAAGIADTL